MKLIVLSVLGVLIVAGLVAVLVTDREVDLNEEGPSVSTEKTPMIEYVSTPSLCTDDPTGTAIGREVYPIDPQYENLEFLGQLFTAQGCGAERLSQIDGVKEGQYTMGSTIWLAGVPTPDLVEAFSSIGFECADRGKPEVCNKWRFDNDISLENLMILKPFTGQFKADDCIKCG